MKTAPVVPYFIGPAILPVFDDSWKEGCKSCLHCRLSTGLEGGTEWRCSIGARRNAWMALCIDARSDNAECGPGAAMRVAK